MQLLAGKTALRQGFSRYRCSNRRSLLALTHRLCADLRQTALSNCGHYSPVNRRGRMRLHGQRSIQLAMATKSAVVLGGLQRKITSRLIKKTPPRQKGRGEGRESSRTDSAESPPRSGFVQPFGQADPLRAAPSAGGLPQTLYAWST